MEMKTEFDAGIGTESKTGAESEGKAVISQVFFPGRRFLARMFDLYLYNSLYGAILMLVFHKNLAMRSGTWYVLLDGVAVFLVMLFLEPLLLSRFKTTLGKWIFGIRLEAPNGKAPSYTQGLRRTWTLLWMGLGLGVPIVSLIRLWLSYNVCARERVLSWDDELCCLISDTNKRRFAVLVISCGVIFAALLGVHELALQVPNRAPLTISHFEKNYNRVVAYYTSNQSYLLRQEEKPYKSSPGTVVLFQNPSPQPFVYETEGEVLTGMSFTRESSEQNVFLDSDQMAFAALAFVGAQKGAGAFTGTQQRLAEAITKDRFGSFVFTEAGVKVRCRIEYEGYEPFGDMGMLVAKEGTSRENRRYFVEFSMVAE